MPPDTQTYVFRKIWRAMFSGNTRFEIRPIALLPTTLNKSTFSILIQGIQSEIFDIKSWNRVTGKFQDNENVIN